MPYARSPKIVLNTKDESRFQLSFRLSDTDVSMANAIRRTMIAEVPTMAINLVTVYENTSALADEYIVHRLGLIPLHSENVDDFVFAYDCECDDYCPRCSVMFRLQVHAPDNSTVRTVTSKDLLLDTQDEASTNGVRPVHDSGDVEVKPRPLVSNLKNGDEATEGIVIVRLSRGQKIDMRCLVRKGIGKDHAKHSPMCTVAYRIMPPAVELKLERINSLFPSDAKRQLVEFSSGLLCLDEQTDLLKYEQPFLRGRIAINPDTCRRAGELAVMHGGRAHEVVQLNPEPKYFDFAAETTGAMPPRQALQMALLILENKVGQVLAHLN